MRAVSSRVGSRPSWRRRLGILTVSALCAATGFVAAAPTAGAAAPPTALAATDSPDPAVVGRTITFSVSWSDPDPGDAVRAVVCRTNAISSTATCTGGSWAVGSFMSTTPAVTSFRPSTANIGTNNYFAFACDAANTCSASVAGTFTVNPGPPTVVSTTASPNQVVANRVITFNVAWTDPTPSEWVRPLICKTNALSAGSCTGGAWATGSYYSGSPASASYRATMADVGTRDYWAFACDLNSECSTSGVAGSFSVLPAPACSDGVDNDGDGKTDHPADPGCASIDDQAEGPTCRPLQNGVVACLEPAAELQRVTVRDVEINDGTTHTVAGYVDLYRFLVSDVSVTLPCVRLVADNSGANACAAAGGQFAGRLATLIERTEAEPKPLPGDVVQTAAVCEAELTLTAFGIGVNSARAYALC